MEGGAILFWSRCSGRVGDFRSRRRGREERYGDGEGEKSLPRSDGGSRLYSRVCVCVLFIYLLFLRSVYLKSKRKQTNVAISFLILLYKLNYLDFNINLTSDL